MSNVIDSNDPTNSPQNMFSQFKIKIIIVFLSFALFTALTGEGIIIPVFPLYLKTFQAGAFQLGLLIGGFSLTSLILSPVIGSLADRYGRKIFIIIGLLGFSIANILYTQAYSFEELFFFRIIEGSTAAAIGPIVNAMVIDIIPEQRRGHYLGLVNGSGFMGVIIGPFLGGLLVQNGNYQLPFELSALVAFIGMIFALIILPNDYNTFKTVVKKNDVKNASLRKKVNFSNWVIEGTTVLFGIIIFIRFAGIVSWSLIEPSVSFFLYGFQYDPIAVGFYFSCYGITMFFGQTLLGGLSDKFGRKILLQIGLCIYVLGFCFLLNTHQIIYFYISGCLNGLGVSLIIPSLVAFLADITNGASNTGKIMGFYYGAFYLAGIVGPILGGFLGSMYNFNLVLYISISILVLALFFSFFIKSKSIHNGIVIIDKNTVSS